MQRSIGLSAVLDCPGILILQIGNEMSGFFGSLDENVFSSNSNNFLCKAFIYDFDKLARVTPSLQVVS